MAAAGSAQQARATHKHTHTRVRRSRRSRTCNEYKKSARVVSSLPVRPFIWLAHQAAIAGGIAAGAPEPKAPSSAGGSGDALPFFFLSAAGGLSGVARLGGWLAGFGRVGCGGGAAAAP